jgi:hypothetical protein
MAVTKTISIDGQEVTFRASAAIPRLYRVKFHRDIYRDLDALQKAMEVSDEGASTLDTFSLELFENISYIMARHADPSVPDSPEEWLERFNTFSIYQVLPQVIELWGLNLRLYRSLHQFSFSHPLDHSIQFHYQKKQSS